VFRARLPEGAAGSVVRFPVVQECEAGVHRWIEIPEPGRSADDYEEPAPGVTLTPAAAE
jgi:periplasmic copper chaperone A